MPDQIDTTDDIGKAGWDRRRFLKASAGGAAIAWTAPTVLGLDARAFAAGSDPDCRRARFFDDFEQETVGLTQTSLANFHVGPAGANVDVVVDNTFGISLSGDPGKFIDLDGGPTTTPITVLTGKQPFCEGEYQVRVKFAGDDRGDGENRIRIQLGSLDSGFITPSPSIEVEYASLAVVAGPGGSSLVITHDSKTSDYIGILLLEVEVTPIP